MNAKANRNADTLTPDQLRKMDAWWRAANYLSVGQIYLRANPMLDVPLTLEHIKPRLLGHWGTTPGLNFLYVHLNRLIKENDLDLINIIGPGHGGPGLVASTYLEGTYSELYPNVGCDEGGLEIETATRTWLATRDDLHVLSGASPFDETRDALALPREDHRSDIRILRIRIAELNALLNS